MSEERKPKKPGPLGRVAGVWRKWRGGGEEDKSLEDVVDAFEAQTPDGDALDPASKSIVIAATRFNKKRTGAVMTPRADIVAIDASATLAETVRLFAESQHSRLPIFRETLDDPIGFVHVKDVLTLVAPDDQGAAKARFSDRPLSRIKREILVVPPSMPLPSLLLLMRTKRVHMALVIDEYGGTDGLVSIEDIVEQIIGEIDDEHDVSTELISVRAGGAVEADGRAEVDEVARHLGVDLALADHPDDVDTIAGLAAAIAARVPQRGEVLRHPAGVDFEVLDADPRKVKRLRLRKAPPQARPEDDDG